MKLKTRTNQPVYYKLPVSSNMEQLSDGLLNSLKVGDVVQKKTGNQKHCYIVTYKEEKKGICLSYFDGSGYMETISYDYTAGHWVYNSKDVTQVPSEDNVKLLAQESTNIESQGEYSVKTKGNNNATGSHSFAGGNGALAEGENSFAYGYTVGAKGGTSFCFGVYAEALGNISFVTGYGTRSAREHQCVVGQYNSPQQNTLFEVGNGGDETSRNNAFEVYADGSARVSSVGNNPDSLVTRGFIESLLSSFLTTISGYDETKVQTLKNNNGIIRWEDDV